MLFESKVIIKRRLLLSKMMVHISYQQSCLKNYPFVVEIIILSSNSLAQINFTENLNFSKFKSNQQQQQQQEL
jgi:hypothetical protein